MADAQAPIDSPIGPRGILSEQQYALLAILMIDEDAPTPVEEAEPIAGLYQLIYDHLAQQLGQTVAPTRGAVWGRAKALMTEFERQQSSR